MRNLSIEVEVAPGVYDKITICPRQGITMTKFHLYPKTLEFVAAVSELAREYKDHFVKDNTNALNESGLGSAG